MPSGDLYSAFSLRFYFQASAPFGSISKTQHFQGWNVICERLHNTRASLNHNPKSPADRTGQVEGLSIAQHDQERCTVSRDFDLKSPISRFTE